MERRFASEPADVRPAAVAGQFYPADASELRRTVENFLHQIKASEAAPPKAIIAPHAAFSFCGAVAAAAHARFRPARDTIKRVILIGPSHFTPFWGLAKSSAKAFATPLGLVPVDLNALQQISSLPHVAVLDEAHAREHSLEVQLPFLQVVLNDFTIVTLVVGKASDASVAAAIDALWNGPTTRFVISSNLSHYRDYADAQTLDSCARRAIEQLHPEELEHGHACGQIPIRGFLRAAREHRLHAETVALLNSGDVTGTLRSVVGYGAFSFEERD